MRQWPKGARARFRPEQFARPLNARRWSPRYALAKAIRDMGATSGIARNKEDEIVAMFATWPNHELLVLKPPVL